MKRIFLSFFLFLAAVAVAERQSPKAPLKEPPPLNISIGPGKHVTVTICVVKPQLVDLIVGSLGAESPAVQDKLRQAFAEAGQITLVFNSPEP